MNEELDILLKVLEALWYEDKDGGAIIPFLGWLSNWEWLEAFMIHTNPHTQSYSCII